MSKVLFDRIERAMTLLVLDHPYLGHLCSKLAFVPDPDGRAQGTMATDGRNVYVDIEYASKITDPELLGICVHEILHPGFLHHTRRGTRDPEMWNDACDYEINPFILSEKFVLPPGGLVDAAFNNMSAEQIYSVLEQRPKPPKGGGNKPGQGQGQGQGQGKGNPPPGQPGQPGDKPGQGTPRPRPGRVLDAPDKLKDDAEWQVNVIQAQKMAQMMGKLPGGMKTIIERLIKPVVDWRAETRMFMQESATNDYSWDSPDRRFIRKGLYLPDMKSEDEMGDVVCYWDSSGSTLHVRDRFFSEFNAIVEEMRPRRVFLIMVDAKVQDEGVKVFERDEPIAPFDIHGLGGTDFRPGFEYVEEKQIRPACAIYLTDCIGPFPDAPPEYPVLWLSTTPLEQLKGTEYMPPWGRVIPVEDHDR